MRSVIIALIAVVLGTAGLSLRFGLVKSLAAVGPMLGFVGAALLAYDVFRAPLRLAKRQMSQRGLQAERDSYQRIIERYRTLPDSTHAEAKAEWTRETEALMREADQRHQERSGHFEQQEVWDSFRFGMRGLSLIAVGSLMQSIAALLNLV